MHAKQVFPEQLQAVFVVAVVLVALRVDRHQRIQVFAPQRFVGLPEGVENFRECPFVRLHRRPMG